MSDTATIYGIKNCDTMKKAFQWLEKRGIDFSFHDYRKGGVPEAVLKQAVKAHGWQDVINRKGTTWRQLPDDVKNAMDERAAIGIALQNPSLVKRPLLRHDGQIYLGFSETLYQDIFS